MDKSIVFSKTAKGMAEFKAGGKNLAREHARVLSIVNGKSSVGDLLSSGALLEGKYAPVLEALQEHGLIRKFEGAKHHLDALEWKPGSVDDGLDFGDVLPAVQVEELSPQESVQVWAQAKRGATELKTSGFYSYGKKPTLAAGDQVGLRALVVEDDEELAELLMVLLTEKGMVVEIAPDMPKALAAIQSGTPPDVVLLDIVLPGMAGKDGFDVLTFIRRKTEWAKVPVVMVTSEVSDDQVMKGLKAGADGYIFKPFKWEALYGCIREVVGI
jgi:CheY-like chemotaxis protein